MNCIKPEDNQVLGKESKNFKSYNLMVNSKLNVRNKY